MTTMNRPVQITDSRGKFPNHAYDREPLPSSVVLTNGEHGTAWQRYFTDGLWHRVGGGRARGWDELLAQRNLVLVYDAPERSEPRVNPCPDKNDPGHFGCPVCYAHSPERGESR